MTPEGQRQTIDTSLVEVSNAPSAPSRHSRSRESLTANSWASHSPDACSLQHHAESSSPHCHEQYPYTEQLHHPCSPYDAVCALSNHGTGSHPDTSAERSRGHMITTPGVCMYKRPFFVERGLTCNRVPMCHAQQLHSLYSLWQVHKAREATVDLSKRLCRCYGCHIVFLDYGFRGV